MLAAELGQRLQRTSHRLSTLCEDLDDMMLRQQFDAEFSAIGWHLGHVAWQEELWVLRDRFNEPPLEVAFDAVFDAARPHKHRRGPLLPEKSVLLDYRREVRARVLDRLEQIIDDGSKQLMRGAGLLRFVANHESQHAEIVAALRLAGELSLTASVLPEPQRVEALNEWVGFAGGDFIMGTSVHPDRFDNEAPEHVATVSPFQLARAPVTNGAWLEFVARGGYRDPALWSEAGFAWARAGGVEQPLYWSFDERNGWRERTLFGTKALERERPVCHVSWYEADAFARFAGARLPSEAEWEWAASSEPQLTQMFGSVWQWTGDVFAPYPGFEPQPYRDYSAPWFDGQHRVARGGAFVTEAEIARTTFRNWYLPHSRRAFLGLRLAKDVR
ncbi:MAG TPA: DinB family protein [Polyangiaceae bacterium]|nr:DinB family protein [Polyangiaceae bacterium]